jgi:hypothetical protein
VKGSAKRFLGLIVGVKWILLLLLLLTKVKGESDNQIKLRRQAHSL